MRVWAKDTPPGAFDTDMTALEVEESLQRLNWSGVLELPFVNEHGLLVKTFVRLEDVVSLVILPTPNVMGVQRKIEVTQ